MSLHPSRITSDGWISLAECAHLESKPQRGSQSCLLRGPLWCFSVVVYFPLAVRSTPRGRGLSCNESAPRAYEAAISQFQYRFRQTHESLQKTLGDGSVDSVLHRRAESVKRQRMLKEGYDYSHWNMHEIAASVCNGLKKLIETWKT